MKRDGFTLTQMLMPPVAIILVVAVRLMAMQKHNNKLEDAADKMQQFCTGATDAMRQDALAFESGDPAKQEAAYQRFYEGHALYHSAESLLYCVDALPEMPVGCQINHDWSCLDSIARQIHDTLLERYP